MNASCFGVAAREEECGGAYESAGRRDEHRTFVLLGLVLIGDEGEAEHACEPGDRLVIVADDEGWAGMSCPRHGCGLRAASTRSCGRGMAGIRMDGMG